MNLPKVLSFLRRNNMHITPLTFGRIQFHIESLDQILMNFFVTFDSPFPIVIK